MEKLKKYFITIQIGIILFSSIHKILGQQENNYFEGPKFEIVYKSLEKFGLGDLKGALKDIEKGIRKISQ